MPQDQDTGGFFIAILHKKQSITPSLLDPTKSINIMSPMTIPSNQTTIGTAPLSNNHRRATSSLVSKRQYQNISSDESFILMSRDAEDLFAIK